MIESYKKKSLTGAKKAIGQLNKVVRMLEGEAYCMDILQQIRAVEGLLNSLSANVLESHLQSCGRKAFESNDKRTHEKHIKELMIAFKASKK